MQNNKSKLIIMHEKRKIKLEKIKMHEEEIKKKKIQRGHQWNLFNFGEQPLP
jgi:hypothetical protein